MCKKLEWIYKLYHEAMGISNITQEAGHTFKPEGLAIGKDNRQARQQPEIKMKGL